MGPDVNARQELTLQPVLLFQASFFATIYFSLNPRLFHLRRWLVPVALGSAWSLCTQYGFTDVTKNSWNFALCAAGITAAVKLVELATLNEPPRYRGQPACLRQSVLCRNCATNTISYFFDQRCLHWDNDRTHFEPEDTRRDGSHVQFYIDTFWLVLKYGLFFDASLAVVANMKTEGIDGPTVFRDSWHITKNYTLHLPHPFIGAIPIALAVGTISKVAMDFDYYVITLMAAPLTMLPPSVSPHSRPASALKKEWPILSDHLSRSTSLREFWSKRWQSTRKRCFVVLGGNPGRVAGAYVGESVGYKDTGSRAGYVMGVFLASGLMHDFGMWGMGRGMDFRRVTGFFLLQGLGILVEEALGLVQSSGRKEADAKPNGDIRRSIHNPGSRRYQLLMKVWVLAWVLLPGIMMMDAWLQRGFDVVDFLPEGYSPSKVVLNAWNHYAFGE